MEDIKATPRGIFFIISLFTGLILLFNFIDYQPILSTGDHGLLLYAAEASLRGELPFHDYHYFYGPLMPYYYGLFMKTFGTTILSVLIGQQFLVLLCGLLVYGTLSLFLNPFISFAGCLWFWVFNRGFFYTYNHVGIIVASLAVLYCVFHYLKHGRARVLYFALFSCVVAGLIKLNFGAVLLTGLILSVFLTDAVEKRTLKKSFYLPAVFLGPAAILLSNAVFLIGLPFYIIRQCYQYFGNDALAEQYPSLFHTFGFLLTSAYDGVVKHWHSELILVMIAVIALANLALIKKGRIKNFDTKNILLTSAIVVIFSALNLHEFLMSGIYFRIFYSFPFVIVLFFLIIGFFAGQSPRFIQYTLTAMLCVIIFSQFSINMQRVSTFRLPFYYLPFDKAKIFVGNKVPWPQTVIKTTQYLNTHVKEGESFLALPYDPLYYYLTDKKSPTRQLVFFNFQQIPKEQELTILNDLKKNNVNWVLISNRAITQEDGLGVFGETNCPMLAAYIDTHYEVVAEFGPWTPAPSWAWLHGTRILKKRRL